MLCPQWRFTGRNRINAGNGGHAQRGSVSVETIATLLLVLLLGIGIFSLAVTSTSAYTRLYEGKNLQSELRVALSFVQMKVRQNDLRGAVGIGINPVNRKTAVVIREEYDGEVYETWIYQDDGKLREAIMPEGEAPSNDLSFEIADVDGFSVDMDGNRLNLSVWIDQEDGQLRMESSITLRSE